MRRDTVDVVFGVDRGPDVLDIGALCLCSVEAVEGEIPWVVVGEQEARWNIVGVNS